MTTQKIDPFLSAYIQTALWSSTEYQFGPCPCCGRPAVLNRYPEKEFQEDPMCAAEGCGTREIPNPDPMDRHYSESDLAPETLAKMAEDCAKFRSENEETIRAAIESGEVKAGPDFDGWERAAHDFWLTRNGHGAGFWDGDWPKEAGEILTKASKSFGSFDLYAGDDGQLHGSK